ncbi:MAG: ABC transporter permease [Clostridia bacterium]|nr:ABC transporter permease [Clostridia bacterium]
MKSIISDIWSGIKKSPFLFFFIFIQIVITSVVLYSMLATFYWTEEQTATAQTKLSDNEYLRCVSYPGIPGKIISLVLSSNYQATNLEKEKRENLSFFYKIDSFYKDLRKNTDIMVLVCQNEAQINLKEPKEWEEADKTREGNGLLYSEVSTWHPFDNVKALVVGSNYLDYFDIKLSEGEYFQEEDYLYEGDYVPVLMGSIYKKYYTLGEEFEGHLQLNFKKTLKFKVIGFIAENQYFAAPAHPSSVSRYDNYIVVPDLEKDLDGCLAANFSRLFTARFIDAYYACEPQKLDDVKATINTLLEKNGLGDYFYAFRCRSQSELASNYVDKLSISIAACIATLLFSLFSFIFTMLYKIDDNIKNYAIRMVVGETYANISFRYLFESFIVFFLGQLTGYFAFKIYSVYSFIYEGYKYLEEPTLKTGLLLNIAFYIITAVILSICVNVKLRTYSLATLIRGNEVKREKRIPLYRVVIFIMLAIVGVFGMFIASYKVADARIDVYYTGFFTKNVKNVSVNRYSDPDAPEVVINIDEIGEKADNAVIFRFADTRYRGDDLLDERGIYYNGYIDSVNMLEGRFFTPEETASENNDIAVVGKEVYKYVTFDEKGNAYYYSDYLEKNFRVIGVMGKEDQSTSIDLMVLFPIKTAIGVLGPEGNYYIDGKDKQIVDNLEKAFISHAVPTANVSSFKFTPRITVEAPADILIMLLIIIIINSMVFCFYYVSKQGHIHAVKKIIGYSKTMILTDTFTDFLLLSLGAFVAGNALVVLLKETLFANVQLFSIYMLDPFVILVSLAGVILLTVFLSVIAVTKTFASGNMNQYRS